MIIREDGYLLTANKYGYAFNIARRALLARSSLPRF